MGFSGSSVGKESACSAGDPGSIPGSAGSPGERNGKLLQYFCLENPMDSGAWWTTVRGVTRVEHGLVTKPGCPKHTLLNCQLFFYSLILYERVESSVLNIDQDEALGVYVLIK